MDLAVPTQHTFLIIFTALSVNVAKLSVAHGVTASKGGMITAQSIVK